MKDLAQCLNAAAKDNKTQPTQEELEGPTLYYAKKGRIYTTTLYSADYQSIMDWAMFVHPALMLYPDELHRFVSDFNLREKLYDYLSAGISLYNTLLKPDGVKIYPHTYNGMGH